MGSAFAIVRGVPWGSPLRFEMRPYFPSGTHLAQFFMWIGLIEEYFGALADSGDSFSLPVEARDVPGFPIILFSLFHG